MKRKKILVLVLPLLISGVSMAAAEVLSLKYQEQREIDSGVSVCYSSFGHEHVSYSPDEPFAATVAVFGLTLFSGDNEEDLFLDFDINREEPETFVVWDSYQFRIMKESDQDHIVFELKRTRSE